ncbi:hypothetical protein [Nocardioides litoris]|uniref:hypothetical protein n=1 Tax=Nocardioides litoris TaxID=1926648 RepID=UPI00111EFD89|nr:hypothetical protein [Nocardioides litoris]
MLHGRRWTLALLVGLLLVVGGAVVAVLSPAGAADLGWFAYTPLSGEDPSVEWSGGSAHVVSTRRVAAVAVAVVGLVLAAAAIGFRAGRRRSPAAG